MFPTMYRDGKCVRAQFSYYCTHLCSSKAHWPIWQLEVSTRSLIGGVFDSHADLTAISLANVFVLVLAPVSNTITTGRQLEQTADAETLARAYFMHGDVSSRIRRTVRRNGTS